MNRENMLIKTIVLDDAMQQVFAGQVEVDPLAMMIIAEDKEDEAKRNGADWTSGAIPFFGQELVNALRDGKSTEQINMQAVNVAMFAWLMDSIFDGVTAESFIQTDLVFTIIPGGVVKYDRVPG
jgi:hypothetical protein